MSPKSKSNHELFFAHVIPKGKDECWLWEGSKRGQYGGCRYNGKTIGAHQASYQLFVGDIPDGLEVMHKCDTPLCVNPNHLTVGTHLQNMHDARDKKRLAMVSNPVRGSDVAISKLTDDQVREIRRMKAEGYSHRVIGAKFGVSNVAVFKIVHRRMWAHLE